MKSFYYILLFLGVPLWLSAQSSTQNYIVGTVPYQAVANPTTLTDANSNTNIQYFDGLGRPSQTVQRSITPSGADLVSGIEYDGIGRDYRHWLSGSLSGNSGAYVTDFGTPAVSTNGGDSKPYATTEYDGSPLNRVTGQYGAGVDWYNNTKKKTIAYTTNGSDVKHYYVDGTQLKCDGPYSAATLYGQKTTDEDGKTWEEFTDKQGRKVLSRMADGNDTYYVYDELVNLRYVLPPLAADALGTNTSGFGEGTGTPLDQYSYIYHYDGRKRCTEKKLPGCDWIYMVYDLADRLILSQDGNQRAKAQWTVNKYDVLGRLLYSGLITNSNNRLAMESTYSGSMTNENYTGSGITGGYTCTNLAPVSLLTVNYYDNYNFLSYSGNNPSSMLTNTTLSGYDNPDLVHTKTLLTVTRVYHLDNPALFEVTALYYDKYGRVVQSRATNHLLGYDITYNALDFTGKPTKTYKTHGINGTTPSITELYTYAYDKAQRSTTTTYSLNGGSTVTLVSSSYDELGRLTTKKRHTNTDTESYTYNVRSWTTNITSGSFQENLYYNTNPLSSNVTFNGNISYSTWTYNGASKGYLYGYDALNRLLSASFKQGTSGQGDDSFSENFTYDKMGNIITLQRKKDNVLIDDLTLHYKNGEKSNQLEWVNDSKPPLGLNLVKEYQNNSTATSNEFAYDANGNMIKDLDRNIVAIQYNVLNLPNIIQFKNGNQIKNTYDAGGHKLGTEYFTQLTNITPLVDGQIISQSYIPGTVGQTGNAYIGNMEYNTQNGNSSLTALNRIYNDEGYVETPGNSQYYYYRKDHLGNNREVWLANTNTTKQWTQYYPSGLPLACSSSDNPGLQSRKYNGKEFIEMHGYDTYDYGARGMYPALDIMPTIDRFAEKYYSLSPYGFAAGNPINNIDINGDSLMFFKNGKYLRTIDNGKTEMTGYNQETTVDKNGKETFTGGQNFNFNDSEVDPQAIRNGAINMVEFVSDATVNNQINRSGVNNHKGIGYAYTESHAGGRMDYGYQGIEKFKDLNNHTFYVRSGTAYNVADYGNYLWGRGMALLGIDAGVASLGAHFNNFRSKLFGNTDYYSNYNFGKGTYGQPDWFDSPADQRAIIKGSQSVNRTYKPKPFAWPMNHFTLK